MKKTNCKHTKKNTLRTVLQTVLVVVIALSIGLGVYHWNAKALNKNALPMPFGVGMAVVVSGSMEPELSVNDLIVVKPCDVYAVGDVVVFSSGASLVVHRILSIDGETVVTKGDANNTADAPIRLEDIKGRVVATLPHVGAAVEFIQSTGGTLLILLLAVYFYWRSLQSEKREAEREIEEIQREIDELKSK